MINFFWKKPRIQHGKNGTIILQTFETIETKLEKGTNFDALFV
jgi:hypothetical protein